MNFNIMGGNLKGRELGRPISGWVYSKIDLLGGFRL